MQYEKCSEGTTTGWENKTKEEPFPVTMGRRERSGNECDRRGGSTGERDDRQLWYEVVFVGREETWEKQKKNSEKGKKNN